jgi:hypothetical protein
MQSLLLIIVTLSPLPYFQWQIAVSKELAGAAMNIVIRRLRDEGCDLERDLLADLAGRISTVRRMNFCFRATWCVVAGYLAGALMRPPGRMS